MEGACSSATLKSSRTSLGPSPRYFWINSEPTTRRKVADVWLATALASSVLPVDREELVVSYESPDGPLSHIHTLVAETTVIGSPFSLGVLNNTHTPTHRWEHIWE